MSELLRRLLLRYLTLGVEPGDEDPVEPETPPEEDAAGTGDAALDDLIDAIEPEPSRRADPDDNPIVREARERAAKAERELAEERAARRPAPTPDADYEREERMLAQARATGDENTISWTQFRVDQERRARRAEANSQQAMSRAADIEDRTSFDRLEITKPAVYKRYAKRVEEARSQYPNAPRAAILRLLIGNDIMDGKVRPKQAKPAEAPEPGRTVDRGRPPVARSDVRPGKGGMTDKEKRIERLRGQNI